MRKFAYFLIMLLIPVQLFADGIYKVTTPDGVTHYSSTPPTANAKQASLPRINKGDIKIVPPPTLSELSINAAHSRTCNEHGGIDCSAGADSDGSVICVDGYKNAVTRYLFNCKSAKLKIIEVSDLNKENDTFTVTIRNEKSVTASNVSVNYKDSPDGNILLTGEKTIPPFGVEEYTLKLDYAKILQKHELPTEASFLVSCVNCD